MSAKDSKRSWEEEDLDGKPLFVDVG